jgi:predicted nuclease of restriction endonuclease-like (RecB) superfamily
MQQALANGWSRNVLLTMIRSEAHRRQGKAVTNFERLLPPPQSDLARQSLKDPYIFDFLTLEEPFRERELETNLLRHLERFLLELGQGFAFVGRQLRTDVGDTDFYMEKIEAGLAMSDSSQFADKVEVEFAKAKQPRPTKPAKPAAKRQPKKARHR